MAIKESFDRSFRRPAFFVGSLDVFLKRAANLTNLGIGQVLDPDELIARRIQRAENFVKFSLDRRAVAVLARSKSALSPQR